MTNQSTTARVSHTCAILGMDIVAFSTLLPDDQLAAVRAAIKWIRASLEFHDITREQFHWSPAGDGGYLTFKTPSASEKALEVGFSILEKANRSTWIPQRGNGKGNRVELRFGLHAGVVYESDELGGGTNIWGDGINMAARVLSVAANSQVLVSKQYRDTFYNNKNGAGFQFDPDYRRTVKHGVHIEVSNCRRGDLGLRESIEAARRWQPIGAIWTKAIDSYIHLIDDAVLCKNPVAALAAAKFLLELTDDTKSGEDKASAVFSSVGETGASSTEASLRHWLFNVMPPTLLRQIIQDSTPRLLNEGDLLCKENDRAWSCFVLVYGHLLVTGTNIPEPIEISPGNIIGEFALWIPNIRRTATVVSKDDTLVLEVPNELFQKVSAQSPDMANRIQALIKRRLLDNMVRSKLFFPSLPKTHLDQLLNQPSLIDKYPAGARLDLLQKTYILFDGTVRAKPALLDGDWYEVVARAHFGREAVVGIRTEDGVLVDGDFAEVREDCVAAGIDHHLLREMCAECEEVQVAWDAIWGRRCSILKRKKMSK